MKTLDERLNDYILKNEAYDIDTLYNVVLDKHKRAIWKMQSRISDRIENLLTDNNSVFFLTLTYDNEHLPDKEQERKTEYQIKDFMKSIQAHAYVANIDYGKTNGRFHWHAVVKVPKIDNNAWIYGAINWKVVKKDSIPPKLSKYLIKLKRHAVKVEDPLMIYYPRYYKN